MAKSKKSQNIRKGRKRRKQNLILGIFTLALMLTFTVWYGYYFHNLSLKNEEKQAELEELEEELQEKKKELNKKNMEVNYYQSDENIEKIARDELGLVMPQEIVFIQSN